ncbi:MAG: hypothetical protein ABSG64_11035 [Solirubrobacteraceae bacterium]|jgi:hypothetical protein
MNRDWHAAHRLDARAGEDERTAWHREHAARCGCRQPPARIAALLAAERAEPTPPSPSPAPAARPAGR